MMTTLAALMGALPIALGVGAGAELRQPLGLAVVGGLVVSQVLTLYITPVIFIYLELARRYFFPGQADRRGDARPSPHRRRPNRARIMDRTKPCALQEFINSSMIRQRGSDHIRITIVRETIAWVSVETW